jgi:flagellar export protein FliJ
MARRFQFSLQTLLRVRQLAEREAGRKVGAKRAEIARLDSLNADAQDAISQQHRALETLQRGDRLDPGQLSRPRAWIAHLRRAIAERQSIRAGWLQELGVLQAALIESRKQTKTIEKLRERRLDAHGRAIRRREQHDAEELAQQLHGHVDP